MNKYYGLRKKDTKDIATYTHSSNEGGYACGERTFELRFEDYYPIWMTTDRRIAEGVVNSASPEWYNSNIDSPVRRGYEGVLEVFEFTEKNLGKTVFVSNFFKCPPSMDGGHF